MSFIPQFIQPATAVCRRGVEICDVAERCTGTSATCPEDSFQPSTTRCRKAAGACDLAESCTGSSAACPGDSFQPPAAVCRAAAEACDVTERCSGTSAARPIDAFQPPTEGCDGYRCDGTRAGCPSTCTANAGCLSPNLCVDGACAAPTDAGSPDGGAPDAGTASPPPVGCGCGATSPALPFMLLALLGLAVRRRGLGGS